jgi:5-methylcytosine-specific restriction endonuclease McrBC GTP-binding regulatory subunit McrB
MEQQFREWLKETKELTTEQTINNYIKRLNGHTEKYKSLRLDNGFIGNVFDSKDIDRIFRFYERLLKNGDLYRWNQDNDNMALSAALRKYKKFLEQRNNTNPAPEPHAEEHSPATSPVFPLNQILYGPPGTGKTYSTVGKALEILKADDEQQDITSIGKLKAKFGSQVEFVTFHQSFSYEDFVEGLKANSDDGRLTYEIENGVFKQICRRAKGNEKPHILIIDEINRGNISRIFGELITLIEPSKRAGNEEEIAVKLPYSKQPFSVPNNLHIIATMNTADRSLTLMDTALRRRFDFEEMPPKYELVKGNFEGINVGEILKSINQKIEILYDKEHTIGHSFLMKVEDLKGLRTAFKHKILPLLEEYFYDDFEKVCAVLNDKNNAFYQQKNHTLGEIEKTIYTLENLDELTSENFIQIYQTSD